MKRVLTYGTFDILHYGHLQFLKRAKALGDYLIVGVSSDEFNEKKKGKKAYYPFAERLEMVEALKVVDQVFEQKSFEQKKDDIQKYQIDILVSSEEYEGKYDYLKEYCEVVYLKRTPFYSSSQERADYNLDDIINNMLHEE